MSKQTKQTAKASTPIQPSQPIATSKPEAIPTSKPDVRLLEAIKADIATAIAEQNVDKLEQLFVEKAKAEKIESKAKAEFRKANADKFANNRITFASYVNEAITEAVKAFEAEYGDIAEYIGDKLQAIRYTPAGIVDKAGVATTKASTALLTATAKKQTGGTRIGNFNAGKRGDMLGSGMSEAQIVHKFGSDEEIAEYDALAENHTANRNKCYGLAVRLWKASQK